MSLGAIDLAGESIRFDTINPPGREGPCADHLQSLLTRTGFTRTVVPECLEDFHRPGGAAAAGARNVQA